MRKNLIYIPVFNDALRFSATYLSGLGLSVTDTYQNEVTHVLLPVPTSQVNLEQLLPQLEHSVTICCGNPDHLLLGRHRVVDFLSDPYYLADNAAITASCALRLLQASIPDLRHKRILILGWGRIGKCLGKLLQQLGADVTISARRDSDLAMLHALGYRSVPTGPAGSEISTHQAVINTIPELIFPELEFGGVALDLASTPGMLGPNVQIARGLPGKMAPEQSGELIARTLIRLALQEVEAW